MLNLGDFPADATVYVPFHTFSSDDPSASVTITGLAVTDIEIYKNGSVTQRASDNGYTLLDTDGIDFDGITGLHGFSIDLSDNSDSGFYAAGSEYWVAVSSVTVDGATINFWAAVFSIERTGGVANILTDTEAVLSDTEAAGAVLTDTEAILADTEASQTAESAILADTEGGGAIASILADTEASQTAETAILADTESIDTDAEAILSDSEAVLTDTEGLDTATILTDTEAILSDTEGLGVGSGLTPLASGTAQGGTASTIQLASGETFADDELNGNVVQLTGGTGAGQARVIFNYTSSTDTANITPNWTTTPDNTSIYEVIPGSVNLSAVNNDANTAVSMYNSWNGLTGADMTLDSLTINGQMQILANAGSVGALVVSNIGSNGPAVSLQANAGNANALDISGNGTGAAIRAIGGGSAGLGLDIRGGSGNSDAMRLQPQGTGAALQAEGQVRVVPSAITSGEGAIFVDGAALGHAVRLEVADSIFSAIHAYNSHTNGSAVTFFGGLGGGNGLALAGDTALAAAGDITTTADLNILGDLDIDGGIQVANDVDFESAFNITDNVEVTGQVRVVPTSVASGEGALHIVTTGEHAIKAQNNDASVPGVLFENRAANSLAVEFRGPASGSGRGLRIQGNTEALQVAGGFTVSGEIDWPTMSADTMANYFDVDSGETSGSAVAGSVVAEAGGGGGSDWTTADVEGMRYRMGLDGTKSAPSTAIMEWPVLNITGNDATGIVRVTNSHATGDGIVATVNAGGAMHLNSLGTGGIGGYALWLDADGGLSGEALRAEAEGAIAIYAAAGTQSLNLADNVRFGGDFDVIGTWNVPTMSAATMQNYFDVDSGETFDSAVDGSVVKEAGVSVGASVAEEVWTYFNRTLTQSSASVVATLDGNKVTVYKGATWTIDFTGLVDASTYTKAWFTVKKATEHPDSQAVVQINSDDGLTVIGSEVAGTPANGSVTIDGGSDTITVVLDEVESIKLEPGDRIHYDLHATTAGGTKEVVIDGRTLFNLESVVTRATS